MQGYYVLGVASTLLSVAASPALLPAASCSPGFDTS